MSKTLVIDDDVHTLIIEKQSELEKKHGISLKISYIANSILKHHIDKMEDVLKAEIGGVSLQDVLEYRKRKDGLADRDELR